MTISRRLLVHLAVLAAWLSGSGCGMSRHEAAFSWEHGRPAGDARARLTELEWPRRDLSRLGEMRRTGWYKGEESDGSVRMARGIEFVQRRSAGWMTGHAIVEDEVERPLLDHDFTFVSWHPGDENRVPWSRSSPVAQGSPGTDPIDSATYRQSFNLMMPAGEPVGLVVHGFSMQATAGEWALVGEMHKRGWAVLWTSQLSVRMLRDADLDVNDPEAVFRAGEQMFEELLASYAYAGEAATSFVREHTPELRDKPIVLLGFSLGAIAAPTLAARLGDDVSAVVLIGGGADLPAIVAEGTFTRGWNPGLRGRTLSRTRYRQLREEYRKRTHLDPYNTAPLLRNRPVLVVQARWDRIVPAEYGDLLWERLGRPERWMFNGGHLMLFWSLMRYADEIAAWADESARMYWDRRSATLRDQSREADPPPGFGQRLLNRLEAGAAGNIPPRDG